MPSTNPFPHTDVAIHEPLAKRYSPRGFMPDRPLSDEQVRQLFEAARWTPSSFNQQPWRYVYARNYSEDRFEELLATLAPPNQKWAKDASMLIVTSAKTSIEGRSGTNRHAQYDLGAANFALIVQAVSMGLYVHPMAGFDSQKARETCQIPADQEPMAVLAVGYLPEAQVEEPPARTSRHPQDQVAKRFT